MQPSAPNAWSGRIYNADDGQSYTSAVTQIDAGRLEVRGCVGALCGNETWSRTSRDGGGCSATTSMASRACTLRSHLIDAACSMSAIIPIATKLCFAAKRCDVPIFCASHPSACARSRILRD